ncbi:AraC family transcriptional regulator [Paenibacillus hodogayensis]|uniref:AraC family transcriptional regulator n=1 Tax=Paenibacillus hodogayensis TaxID=279208 RepID=A0ABV5VY02_9BACL
MFYYDELQQNSLKYRYKEEQHPIYPLHAHPGMELLFSFQGSVRHVIDSQIHQVEAGSMVLIQPFQLHGLELVSDEPFFRTVFIVDPYYVERLLQPHPLYLDFFRTLCTRKLPLHVITHPYLSDLFAKGRKHFTPQGYPERQNGQLALFLMSVIQTLEWIWDELKLEELPPQTRPFHHAEQAMKWIHDHLTEEIGLDAMAGDLHLSPFYLSRLFHQATGSTVNQYIAAIRVREACLLLKTTELPIARIAEKVGIPNPSYFVRVFKQKMRMTPQRYRNGV